MRYINRGYECWAFIVLGRRGVVAGKIISFMTLTSKSKKRDDSENDQ